METRFVHSFFVISNSKVGNSHCIPFERKIVQAFVKRMFITCSCVHVCVCVCVSACVEVLYH